MLKGKYIKYSEDITLEVFKKIVKKLNDLGWTDSAGWNIEERYKSFKTNNYLTYGTGILKYCTYGIGVIKNSDKELKVSELLGKTEFIKDKWYKINNCWYAKNLTQKGNTLYLTEYITHDGEYYY